MAAEIEIYTRPGCGYCSAAKSLLTRKKAAFTELNVATDATLRQQMWDRAGAGSTFPQIFIGETHVGGCRNRASNKASSSFGKQPARAPIMCRPPRSAT
jgi:glutaredoxin 3